MFGTCPAAPDAPLLPKNHTITQNVGCQYPSGPAQNLSYQETSPDSRSTTVESAAWPSGGLLSPPGRACRCPFRVFASRFRTRRQSPQNLETTPIAAPFSRR